MKSEKKKSKDRSWLALETLIILGLSFKLIFSGLTVWLLSDSPTNFLQTRPAYAQEAGKVADEPYSDEPLRPAMTQQYQSMLNSLKSKEQRLKEKEQRLNERAKALSALEDELNQRLADLDDTRKKLAELVAYHEKLVEDQKILRNARIEHLVTAYKGMRPEKAGMLVNSLEDDVAVKILAAMPGRSAGQILAFVEPVKAARLTKSISAMKNGKDQMGEAKAGQ